MTVRLAKIFKRFRPPNFTPARLTGIFVDPSDNPPHYPRLSGEIDRGKGDPILNPAASAPIFCLHCDADQCIIRKAGNLT